MPKVTIQNLHDLRLTDVRIGQIINYIQERPRWVTAKELRDELNVDQGLIYYVLHTLYMLDKAELGGLIAGRGRPKLAVQWIGHRKGTGLISTAIVEGKGSATSGPMAVKKKVAELERLYGKVTEVTRDSDA